MRRRLSCSANGRGSPRISSYVSALTVGLICCCCVFLNSATADVVRLRAGGLVRGTTSVSKTSETVDVTLLSGAVVRLTQEDVAEITKRPVRFEQYEASRQTMEDSLDGHWELAEWCRENVLPEQRRTHLQRVLDFDPDHEPAHRGLGHIRQDGEWLTKEELEERKREEGFVKFNGRYVPIAQLETLQSQHAQSKAEKDWSAKIGLWLKWASTPTSDKAADGLSLLRGIKDESAMPGLIALLSKHENAEVRRLFVDIVSKINSPRAAFPLATFAVREDVTEIRQGALSALRKDHQEVAQGVFVKALRDPNNTVVRRAALALAKAGDQRAVNPLIQALITTHRFQVRVAVPTVSMRTDGGFGNSNGLPQELLDGLRSGQYPYGVIVHVPQQNIATKVVPVRVDIENEEVRLALMRLTQQNFGFDKNAWTRWWNLERNQLVIAPDLP